MAKSRKRKSAKSPKSTLPPKLPSPAMMDRALRSLIANGMTDAEDEAQELVYDAMSAESPDEAAELLAEALRIDPQNPDALLMLVSGLEMTMQERIAALEMITDIAAQRLGEEAFEELPPHFWGHLETRPFMRAVEELAETLREAGHLEEAAEAYGHMLRLNVGDNQGARYELLPCLLALGRLEEARALQAQYSEELEWNVVFAWGHVLERFLAGDEPGAVTALAGARKQNKYMQGYLTGRDKLPRNLPGFYQPSGREEAQCYAGTLCMAWDRHPAARDWLLDQCGKDSPGPKGRGAKR